MKAEQVKPPPALRLVHEAVAVILNADASDGGGGGSLSPCQVGDLLQHADDETVSALLAFDTSKLTCSDLDKFSSILHHENYDSAGAATQSSHSSATTAIASALAVIEAKLHEEHKELDRTLSTASFCVCVDGSRKNLPLKPAIEVNLGVGRFAFDVALNLRHHGQLHIYYVDEFSTDPRYSPDVITHDYAALCRQRHVPTTHFSVRAQSQRLTQTTIAAQMLELRRHCGADFLVVGSFGTKGPQPGQIGNNTRRAIRDSEVPIIVVPPVPASFPTSDSRLFVVAVDNSPMALVCFGVALKLVKPADRLHVFHVQLPPGPLDLESLDTFKATTAPFFEDKLKRTEVQGCVDVVVNPSGDTIAEVIQQYLADVRAAFLVFGLHGEGAVKSATNRPSSSESTTTSNQMSSSSMKTQRAGNVAAALIASPRCTLVITKE
ncbi:unnamed protein product [Aphanomyces euteiches]|uniref:UspA domain-containing protein n=1 Tax=Aphanomyces euteiches TaxID=100861 RepID=A0A6G0WJY8_9STRA|nr:hypothetical protein Ae201684_014409 [Aphanomyces euteiches]KAH9158177.1 hypothetical protein AeRB84_000010 [Aphanomyces euteiches]